MVWMPDMPVGACHAAHLAHAIRTVGISFHSADYRGFGESEGERGVVGDWNEMVEDQLAFVNHVRASATATAVTAKTSAASKPPLLFIGGSGIGACVAILVANRLALKDVAGLVLLAPALHVPLTRKQQLMTTVLVSPRGNIQSFRLPSSSSLC